MLAQSIATAIAGVFADAAAGVNAALLYKRSMKERRSERRSGRDRRAAGAGRVQLRVAGRRWTDGVPEIDARHADRRIDERYADKEFVARQIKSHREAIAVYQRNAEGPDGELRAFARDILPQLRDHLTMLESLKPERAREVSCNPVEDHSVEGHRS
jgi:Domain of unknown function (DUF4142)